MGFMSLVYHEVRPKSQLRVKPQGIHVANRYEDDLPLPLYVSVEDFEAQMIYLKSEGYTFLSLDEVVAYYDHGHALEGKNVLITFDDAFQSVKEFAYPILKKHDITATLFVVRDWLFDRPYDFNPETSQTLSYDEIMEIKDVFFFANHTAAFHGRKELLQQSISAVFEDLDGCAWICDYPNVFAYPFGDYDEVLIEKLETWGMTLAFTTQSGKNTKTTPKMELNRNIVAHALSLDDFKVMMDQ